VAEAEPKPGGPAAVPSDRGKSALQVRQPPTYDAAATASGGGSRAIGVASFLVFVILPFLLACAYYFGMATPQFVAEARFAVRTLGEPDVGGTQSHLFATAPLQQDAYVVASFIHSPAILDRLEQRVDFRELFAGEGTDFWARLKAGYTREDLLDYWNRHVTTDLDGPSGIVTLKVRAFSPEDARMLAQAIIDESEKLANELSARARADYVRRAEQEVSERREGYRTALDQLNALQNRTAILDPKLRATETGTLLTNLLAEKLDVDARLFVLEQQAATDSPTVRQLRRTQEALKDQIENLRAELANSGTAADNLSSAFRRFSELETDRVLASELYAAARRNLAQAQIDAIRKAVYVTVFVPPALAGESRYPRRIAMPLLILIGLGVAWGVGALAWASVEDHRT
jgi:capsular polysaccharide transport system permease protein